MLVIQNGAAEAEVQPHATFRYALTPETVAALVKVVDEKFAEAK